MTGIRILVWETLRVFQVVTKAPAGTSGTVVGGGVPVTVMFRRRQLLPSSKTDPPEAVTLTVWVPGSGTPLNVRVLPVTLKSVLLWPVPMP